ncbi:MAG TPA: ABC transporter substrate-binding protein [Micropepsaceae bacterium]|nr:ABC transporter substrate-binding protein [Micropepsaceae bacterium]
MRQILSVIFVALLAVLPPSVRAAEDDPAAQQVQKFYASLTDAMKRGKELGLEGRYKALTPVVEETFDLPAMTQLTVGPAWAKISDPDKKAVLDAFERMTIANYAKNFASFNGEQFTVDPMVKMRGQDKIVDSKLIASDKMATPFIYRMHMAGDKWKVVDVYLNGTVSQLALKRADFASTVQSQGAQALAMKINALVDMQMKGG